jgi:hypothetical protein
VFLPLGKFHCALVSRRLARWAGRKPDPPQPGGGATGEADREAKAGYEAAHPEAPQVSPPGKAGGGKAKVANLASFVRPRSWTMFQHVAYQSSGNGRSSQGPSSLLSFAATGPPVARGSAANSSTSAALAALRSAHHESLCMNKTPHRGTINLQRLRKISIKSLGANKISGPLSKR